MTAVAGATMPDIRLHAILDPERCRGRDLAAMARAAATGGATMLQLRDKGGDVRAMIERARAIRAALEGSGVPFVVNDRVDVALAAGADGVHVGQTDMEAGDARRLLGPDAIVGLTIRTREHAEAAPLDAISYTCIGGVFDTLSKENPTAIGLDGWRDAAEHFRMHAPDLPVGAIAGIDASNAARVMTAGADGVAAISAIFAADDVASATRELRGAVDGART